MLLFNVDVPLLEIILGFVILIIIVLIEVIVVMVLSLKQQRNAKEANKIVKNLAEVLLHVKQEEIKIMEEFKNPDSLRKKI